jgi:SAM-dependent methyltransferase
MENQKIKNFIIKIPLSVPAYMLSRKIIALPRFVTDCIKFKRRSSKEKRFSVNLTDLQPCLTDRTSKTPFEPHYMYHPAWAARVVADTKPAFHVDIASTLHFCTIVSAFVPVKFYDYRPAELNLSGLVSDRADLTNLHFESNSVKSLSCLHTIEHVGLGRYGDPIDPNSDLKACKELSRVLAPGGSFIFVTPVGKPKIAFNAHRIYSYDQVLALFPDLKLKEFTMVPDDFRKYGLVKNADPKSVAEQECGCGCFWFTK